MNSTAVILATLMMSSSVVYSIKSISDPIRYVDIRGSYFISIKSDLYRLGTPLDAIRDNNLDMPQFAGRVIDCSSKRFRCKSIAYLKFVIPKERLSSVTYDAGIKIDLERLANGGFHASAVCPRLATTGCVSRTDGSGPALTYQYEVNKIGVLTAIKIQHWSDSEKITTQQNLVLVSRLGLEL
ncbi:hypothetical protein [Rhodanobacter lindaniclasticus]|uniref:hypothetical protein n=1 Tax=Rhodanobacter lindaniclasticus TaxID=75310 RepID=UPI0010A07BF5|nr:hypothetical protein [Rhodanobacter lindaniclasticus]